MSESPAISLRSLEAIEFPQTLALIAALASTDLGRESVLTSRPVSGEQLEKRRKRLKDTKILAATEGLVPALEEPLAPLVAELGRPRPEIDGKALLTWARVLEVSGRIVARMGTTEGLEQLPVEFGDLVDFDGLVRRIRKTVDDRGEVRDDASPRLGKLRRQVNRQRQAAYSGLRAVLEERREKFSEDTVPLHNGRLVVMLKSSDRGRVEGLVHGSSSSGRSLYFEPLAVVESNNALQEAIGEEGAERRRLLAELRELLLSEADALRAHLDLIARIDTLQAAWRFGELCEGRLAELSDGELVLVGARHPLLDPLTSELRRTALGGVGHEGGVTPLDLELGDDERVLVVTGPNAGGKTVALKTVGLLVALNQTGLPIPAAAGSRLPLVDALVAVVGDEQDLMRDRSTFSGRLLRLKEAWNAASPSSLVLLDELGSGTDPQEGAALAQALLERLADRRSRGLVTTHLLELASAALDLEGAFCAAMEFDRESGRPTYRMIAGPPGASEAIALARQLDLPEAWLTRASALVGPEHRTLSQMLAEVDVLRAGLESERSDLARERRVIERERDAVMAEGQALAAARRDLAKLQKRELAEFRQKVRSRLQTEIEQLRHELESGRRRGLAKEGVDRLFADAPEIELEEEESPAVTLGGQVRHRDYGWEGVVESVDGESAEVIVVGKRVRCDLASLTGIAEPLDSSGRTRVEVRHEDRVVDQELKLLGRRVDEALGEIDGYLDRAVLAGRAEVRLVHGHGSGRLRKAVREFLQQHPLVDAFRPGDRREGGDGATVVTLRS